ncbi:3-oxoacyl-[acyl-carrier protein] reductase [Prauserella sediminis]|uniref:3-oxoacyl-[acyl-carrier protein] reductase n=1 Tax=Prauserella sediminis TaxID=577680 RepID=A0A839XW30_9PSEU|nr:SDR family oxidoreductase [Prauserella sediminis]MBB3665594.1 3-oxoacyl-[acyl-carrier protein] reductase [Prauserella sediminis]
MDLSTVFGMQDRVAIVTGAAGGIGAASAEVLAAAGAVVVVADRDGEAAERVSAAITETGGRARSERVDVAEPASLEALVADTVAAYGRLDALVNNAGIMLRRPLAEVSVAEFERMLATNLTSILVGTQAAARVMGPGGAIVNSLSTIIDYSTRETGSYAATKKGGEALTRTFAVELGPAGIRVNGIAPGWTPSGMTQASATRPDGTLDEDAFGALEERMAAVSPLAGVTEPLDCAYAVLYLCSQASRFVTGHVLRVNGGASMA